MVNKFFSILLVTLAILFLPLYTRAALSQNSSLDIRIDSESDDAEESSDGSVNLRSSDLELIYGGSNQTVGLRFNNVNLARGTTVANAHVQFQTDETASIETLLTIQGEASDDASTFTSTNFNISSRERTTASLSWSPPLWNIVGEAGLDQQTPNIAPIIQEIINRPGWISGNSLVIIITGTGERVAEAFRGDPSAAALMHIEFSAGPTATPTATLTPSPTPINPPSATPVWTPTPTPTTGANTIRVPQDHASIQAGINAAQTGDTILVSPGTYVENLAISGKTITLASLVHTTGDIAYRDQTIIDGGGATVITIDASAGPETRVIGFHIRNGVDGISPNAKFEISL